MNNFQFINNLRIGKISKKKISIDLGHEIFLGPEAFFNPEIIDKDYKTSLDELTFSTIEQCPIDYKRMLYSVNIKNCFFIYLKKILNFKLSRILFYLEEVLYSKISIED